MSCGHLITVCVLRPWGQVWPYQLSTVQAMGYRPLRVTTIEAAIDNNRPGQLDKDVIVMYMLLGRRNYIPLS